jgi:hypothetical protein
MTARMPSREYYQRQAEILRNMARATKDPALSARYIKRANEYQVLADAVPLGRRTCDSASSSRNERQGGERELYQRRAWSRLSPQAKIDYRTWIGERALVHVAEPDISSVGPRM